MIAAGYSMDLYCENEEYHDYMLNRSVNKTSFNGETPGGMGEYTGESWAQCARQARANGWVISRDRQRAYCPHCKRKREPATEGEKDG